MSFPWNTREPWQPSSIGSGREAIDVTTARHLLGAAFYNEVFGNEPLVGSSYGSMERAFDAAYLPAGQHPIDRRRRHGHRSRARSRRQEFGVPGPHADVHGCSITGDGYTYFG